MASRAIFSKDMKYRYRLEREWQPKGATCFFIMLNPSTADADNDDPTIRRCIGFAKNWGYGRLLVGNIFAYRATDPTELYHVADPIGPENDRYLREMYNEALGVFVAWGAHGTLKARSFVVDDMFHDRTKPFWALGLTSKGQPRHPLYLKKDTDKFEWRHP